MAFMQIVASEMCERRSKLDIGVPLDTVVMNVRKMKPYVRSLEKNSTALP